MRSENEWVEFDMIELEEARARKKDPRSFSRICCFKKCVIGPVENSKSPIVANTLNIIMIGFNVLTATYTMQDHWSWLIYVNILIGMIA